MQRHTSSSTHHLSHTTLSDTIFVAQHLSHTTLSHTIFHTQLCHTATLSHHDFVTHHLPNIFHTHNFVTQHLCHTHTHHLSHTTLSHTHNFVTHHLCHTPSSTHTHIFVTHGLLHTALSHTIFHTHTHTSPFATLCSPRSTCNQLRKTLPLARSAFGPGAAIGAANCSFGNLRHHDGSHNFHFDHLDCSFFEFLGHLATDTGSASDLFGFD